MAIASFVPERKGILWVTARGVEDFQLEAGLVERKVCAHDGRGHRLSITADGRNLRRRMWPVYARAIEDCVGARLTSAEAKALSGLLDRLID